MTRGKIILADTLWYSFLEGFSLENVDLNYTTSNILLTIIGIIQMYYKTCDKFNIRESLIEIVIPEIVI